MPSHSPLCLLEWIVVFSMQTSNLGKLNGCTAQSPAWVVRLGGISPTKKQPHQAFIQLLAAQAQSSLAFSYPRQWLGLVATFLFLEQRQRGKQVPVMGTGTGLIWDKVSCTGKTLYTEIGQLLACTEEKSRCLNKEEATFMSWNTSQI